MEAVLEVAFVARVREAEAMGPEEAKAAEELMAMAMALDPLVASLVGVAEVGLGWEVAAGTYGKRANNRWAVGMNQFVNKG